MPLPLVALGLCALAQEPVRLDLPAGLPARFAVAVPIAGDVVTLNPDAYFHLTLTAPNQAPLLGSFGPLNPSGHATARFTLAPGTNPALAFQSVNHAWALIDPVTFTVEWISEAQSPLLLP